MKAPIKPSEATTTPSQRAELSAAEKLYEATQRINAAKNNLDKLQGQYKLGDASYAQCEMIEDDLHEALVLLGQ